MDVSICTCIYNNLPLVKQVINAVKDNPVGVEYEHLLIYNHPRDETILPWLQECSTKDLRIKILDPGKNIGCTDGYAYGFEQAAGKYIIKLDDDTICPNTSDWGKIMINCFNALPKLAIITPNNNVLQGGRYNPNPITVNGQPCTFYQKMDGIISFTCSMTPKDLYKSVGGFVGGVYLLGQRVANASYYGGEEADYVRKTTIKGYICGYIDNIRAVHLDNTNRDPDYVLWKYCHGYRGIYKNDYVAFSKDINARLRGWSYIIREPFANDWHKAEAAKFLKSFEQVPK